MVSVGCAVRYSLVLKTFFSSSKHPEHELHPAKDKFYDKFPKNLVM